jgi:glycosyltransferase involved in cell wall biosynthesis
MVSMSILINASNLHVGGGVQVAASFIYELTVVPSLPDCLAVWMSTEVEQSLRIMGCDFSRLPACSVVDTFGLKLLLSPSLARRLRAYDTVFTVFGPLYSWRQPKTSIVGFAQPWIIYPDNEIYHQFGWRQRLSTQLKFWIQSIFYRRANLLVAELEHVRSGLVRSGVGREDNIIVVYNCLSSLFHQMERWQPVEIPTTTTGFKLGFLGRNYPHKNTAMLPLIHGILRREHGLDVNFFVTFTDDEWAACGPEFRSAVMNVGPLSVAQCPAFYKAMDGIIFPSLLECFSATPLEAMAMERPLFASDRPFNRDVCGLHAEYFDPLDPSMAASVIANYIRHREIRSGELLAAREHALSFSNAAERARQYLGYVVERQQEIGTHVVAGD